jgi:magnesium-transporting ATPase (P-type)
MDMLCTDKTGTLTEAMIALVRVIDGSGSRRIDGLFHGLSQLRIVDMRCAMIIDRDLTVVLLDALIGGQPFGAVAPR